MAEMSTSLPRRLSKRKTTFLESSRATKKKRHNCDSGSHDLESVEYLSAEAIFEDMVILGCITEIRTSCLKFALPGCLQGTVSIHDISSVYNMCLEKNEVMDSLNTMFHIGQTLACKVLTVNKCAKSQKCSINLTVNPSVVNKDLRHSTLCQNMVLNAAVTSIEDHGYVMDIGNQISSFIDKSSVDAALKVGQVLQAVVSVVDVSSPVVSLIVCNNPERLKESSDLSLSCFLPGTKVDAIIQMQHSQGLLLNVIGFPGCICKQHFTCQQLKKSSTDSGIKISGTVLYVHPLTRMIYVVQNRHLSLKPNAWRKWDIFDNATIICVCKNSVFLNLEKNVKGQAMKWELSDKKIDDLSNYGVNTVHKCRILSVHPMDGIIKVTLKQSAFRMKILNPGELEIGQIVKAKVRKFVKGGMIVKLSSNIQGLVRDIHMAAGYTTNPNSLYVPGSEVICRILSMDFNISPYSLTLTCKKMLLNPDLSILSAYTDAYPGFTTIGVIVDITPKTLLLSFFNDVQGIVLDSKSGNLEQMYFIGQVVKCCVMHSEPGKNRLRVSLKIDDSNLIKSKPDQTNNIALGQVRDVILTSKRDNGYDVQFVDSSDTAFLPNGHLTDILEGLDCLKKSFVVNDILSVLPFSSRKINIVTRKFSFIQAARNNSIFTSMNCFQVGMIVPAVVKSHQPDGMMIDLGCNIKGFVPKRFIKDEVVNLTRYQPCQSLMAKIVSLDKSEHKIELSTRMCDVYDGNPEYGLDVLQCYLKDNEKIKKNYQTSKGQKRKLSKLEVGNTATFKVAFVKSKQIYGKLENGILAIADTKSYAENIESDQLCTGVILFIDYENCCVHLSLSAHLVECVKAFQHVDLRSSKVKIGQLVKCSAVFISKNFIFVHLLGAAIGSFAYLPSKQVINDEIGQSSFYSIGKSYHVIIKRILDGKVLAVLKKHDNYIPQLSQELNSPTHVHIELEKNNKQNCTNVIRPSIHETPKMETEENHTDFGIAPLDDESLLLKYPIGKIFTAIITGNREFQLNVVINDELKGRIHVTDLGCSSEGLFPIRKFEKGNELKIRIVEFSEVKCYNYLPISHCCFRKYAECVPMECPYISPYREFCVGENAVGFIKEVGDESLVVWLTSKQTAQLPFLHIPLCIKELRRIKRNFKLGQAIEAQVLHKTKSHYVLSKLGQWSPYPGENVTAIVQSICPDQGLVIKLAHGYHGEIPVNDISSTHSAVGEMLLQFLRQRFIVCKVSSVNTEAKLCSLSIVSSR